MRFCFFFSSRRRHTRCSRDWSSDVCSSDLVGDAAGPAVPLGVGSGGRHVAVVVDEVVVGGEVVAVAGADAGGGGIAPWNVGKRGGGGGPATRNGAGIGFCLVGGGAGIQIRRAPRW